ncbi:MarR family transcriptional regulator [Intestinibacillus massiliensis]|nr:MarR family transcriptional regulator [Intestinibacillus massiliensis]
MSVYEQFNTFMVDIWGRINKIEERALAAGLEADISITEIHIIEKIGDLPCRRMSDVARAIGITLATLTVACDKLETKGLIARSRDQKDKRVVNVSLTPRGMAAYEFHKRFHAEMMQAVLGDLTEEEAGVLGSSLQKLQNFFESYE